MENYLNIWRNRFANNSYTPIVNVSRIKIQGVSEKYPNCVHISTNFGHEQSQVSSTLDDFGSRDLQVFA